MANTQKLFYASPALFEAEALIISVEGSVEAPLLVLDRSIFYPEGGGQPCDLGTVGGFEVAAVTEERSPSGELRILHALKGPLAPGRLGELAAGRSVGLSVDGGRRLDYSQQHSAQHLLSATFMRLLGAATVSVHLGRERCLIDLDIAALPDEDLSEAESLVEEAIAQDRPIRVHSCPPEDLSTFELRKRPPAGEEEVRIVEIEGIDFTPCCGTHAASAGALRLVRVLGTEKYKGMTRLTFVAGARAAADYRTVSLIAREAAQALGTSIAELPAALSREAEQRKRLERANLALVRERAAIEASEAIAAGAMGEGPPLLVALSYADRPAEELMETAKALASAGTIALLASVGELTVLVLSPAGSARLGESLKPLLVATGGRGGGGPASFRAVFPDAGSLESFMGQARNLLDRR